MAIEELIIELLRTNNCVVIPNFGGFISNYKPAFINKAKQKIYPPSKDILFNQKLINNDGLLANSLVKRNAISFDESMNVIQNSVVNWREKLKEEKRLQFGEIGYLYAQDNQIFFEQNREINLLLSAYGLSSIQFISSENQEVIIEKKEESVIPKSIPVIEVKEEKQTFVLNNKESIKIEPIIQEDEKIVPIQKGKSKSRKLIYGLAAACILPALFYSYWIPVQTDFLETGNITMSDFNPLDNLKNRVYEMRQSENDLVDIIEEQSFEDKINGLDADVKYYQYELSDEVYLTVKLEDEIEESTTDSGFDKEYQLIAGCFSVEENAKNLVSQLENSGFTAYVLDKKGGLYRVAANGFETIGLAREAKSKLESQNISSWVFRK